MIDYSNFETKFEILWSFQAYITLFLLKLSVFEFLVPHCNLKKIKWSMRSFFSEFEIFDVRFGISFPTDISMGGVAIAWTKNGDHTRPYVATA